MNKPSKSTIAIIASILLILTGGTLTALYQISNMECNEGSYQPGQIVSSKLTGQDVMILYPKFCGSSYAVRVYPHDEPTTLKGFELTIKDVYGSP